MDERDDKMRQIAADLGIDWDELKACEDAWLARDARMAEMAARFDEVAPQIAAAVTRDFLRPALLAAGFDGEVAEQYEVSWVREDGFRPGLFAQEGDRACAPGNLTPCPPWPDYVYDKARAWPVPVYTQDEFAEDVKPCRPVYCARHYGNVADAECVGAYQCPEGDE